MSIQRSCKYVYILIIFSALAISGQFAYAQATDTTAADSTEHKVKKKDIAGHQLCIGFDVLRPVLNDVTHGGIGYGFEADYYMRNEFYLAAEGGWGSSNVNYDNLKYSTTNNFLSFGFNKSILARNKPMDWDMMFIGMRLGAANVARSPASYIVIDSVWGNSAGSSQGQAFLAVWAELTGGMRVELIKGLMAGWNFRGRFLLNARSFEELAPLYIAGYGRGDKGVAFDFNVYVSYGIRWKRRSLTLPSAATVAPVAK